MNRVFKKGLKILKSRVFLVSILLLVVILLASSCEWGKQGRQIRKSTKDSKKEKQKKASELEIWRKKSKIILRNVASTSSIVLSNGTVRCYFSEGGYINYIESKDGKDFGEKVRTNIGSDKEEDKPVNPAVLRLRSGRLMLLYNTGLGGEKFEGHSPNTKLHLAYSDDGKTFQGQGVVADFEKDQNAVVDVVDMVLLPDRSIRLYGAENGISTAVSKDGGRTWVTDGSHLIEGGGVDPDVHIKSDGTFVMYYSVTVISAGAEKNKKEIIEKNLEKNYIKMAVSKDGLNWKPVEGWVISPDKGNMVVFDPDYVRLNDETEIMYFSQSRTAKDKEKGKANLRIGIKD